MANIVKFIDFLRKMFLFSCPVSGSDSFHFPNPGFPVSRMAFHFPSLFFTQMVAYFPVPVTESVALSAIR